MDAGVEPVGRPELPPMTGRLGRLARAALDQQGVAVRRLRWMGEHSNYLFRCDTTSGDRLVVRVCLPPPDGRGDAELAWIDALARVVCSSPEIPST